MFHSIQLVWRNERIGGVEGGKGGLVGGGREEEVEATGGVLHGCCHEQTTGGHGGACGTLHEQGMQEGQGEVREEGGPGGGGVFQLQVMQKW